METDRHLLSLRTMPHSQGRLAGLSSAGAIRFACVSVQMTSQAFSRRSLPEYAVVDLKLASRSGLECVRMLHEHDPNMKIVVLTGFASIATAVEAIKLGACHYLAKPSNTDDIETAFRRADGDEIGRAFQPADIH